MSLCVKDLRLLIWGIGIGYFPLLLIAQNVRTDDGKYGKLTCEKIPSGYYAGGYNISFSNHSLVWHGAISMLKHKNKPDIYLIQGMENKCGSLKENGVEEKTDVGEGSIKLIRSFDFLDKDGEKAIKTTMAVLFTENEISFESSHEYLAGGFGGQNQALWNITIPIEHLIDKKITAMGVENATSTHTVSPLYKGGVYLSGMIPNPGEIRFESEIAPFSFAASQGTVFKITDGRSWGAVFLHVLFYPEGYGRELHKGDKTRIKFKLRFD